MKKYKKSLFKVNMTAPEVVIEIVRVNPEISSLFFEVYAPSKNLREEIQIPISLVSLDRMLHHNPPNDTIEVKREEITLDGLGWFNKIINSLNNEVLGFTSRVKLQNKKEIFHIPLMDFNCKVSSENLEKVKEFLTKIGQREGVILFSGRSYHYYGVELLSQKEWLVFLGKCLLFVDYADQRYIGHRLIDDHTTLRISKGATRPQLPWVISVL